MLPLPSSRAEQARRYLAIRSALGLPNDGNPTNSKEAASAAIAEAVSTYANGSERTLAEVFCLADAVMLHRYEVAGSNPAIYHLPSLSASGISELTVLACKLCGGYLQNNRWQDDGVGEPVLVEFPESFFEEHLRQWVELL